MKRISAVTNAAACVLSMTLWSAAVPAQTMNPVAADRSATSTAPQASQKASRTTSNYVQRAVLGNLFEIQSSDLALTQAARPDVKAFAQRMIDDHTTAAKALAAGIESANLTVKIPDKLDRAHEAKITILGKAKDRDRDFDRDYLREQILAHKAALQLHQDYAQTGDNPALQNTAATMAVAVEQHLAEAWTLIRAAPPQTSSTRGDE